MYKNDSEIFNRVEEHYNTAVSLGEEVVGVFLQGSQNYNLGYEGSDVDTKAIVLPKFESFLFCESPISTVHIMANDEHLDLKDIRVMFKTFEKQSPNFMEILFTRFYKLNPEYQEFINPLILNREKIVRYDNYASVNAICGMIYQKYAALEHPYPSLKDKIDKYGYDSKQLHHIIRMTEFLERFLNGESYADALIPKNPDYLLEVKKGYYTLAEARKIAKENLGYVDILKENYLKTHERITNQEVKNLLTYVLTDILRYSFKKQLN